MEDQLFQEKQFYKLLNQVPLENLLGGDDILTSYSLRHAFKDRYIAAGVSEGVGQYFMGHKTKASSEVHENYGGLTEPHRFIDDMTKITKVVDFGYVERFDDDILTPI